MSYLMSNRTSLNLMMSPHLSVNGHRPYIELRNGSWVKFHKTPWEGVCEEPHIRVTAHPNDHTGREEFTGKACRGTMTTDGLWRVQFSHRIPELRSMPLFGQSLSDQPPIRLGPHVWIFPLPRIRRH